MSLFDVATAAEQTPLAGLSPYYLDEFRIGADIKRRSLLVMNIVARAAFKPVAAVEQEPFDAGVWPVIEGAALGNEHRLGRVMQVSVGGSKRGVGGKGSRMSTSPVRPAH